MRRINRQTAEHYQWKEHCDGWHLVAQDTYSIIAEKMPPHTAEDMYYHCAARQFFYILSGQATMRFSSGKEEILDAKEGIEIEPYEAHQMLNHSESELEFLVVSVPKSHGDRVLV